MSATGYRNILIGSLFDADPVRLEYLAASGTTIKPGQLLERTGTGSVQEHSAAAGVARPPYVALETLTPDSDNTPDIDIVYTVGDTVYCMVPRPGDVLYMFLADGENVAEGATLVSDGNGDLAEGTEDTSLLAGAIVCTAEEAVNNSAGGAPARIKVRF